MQENSIACFHSRMTRFIFNIRAMLRLKNEANFVRRYSIFQQSAVPWCREDVYTLLQAARGNPMARTMKANRINTAPRTVNTALWTGDVFCLLSPPISSPRPVQGQGHCSWSSVDVRFVRWCQTAAWSSKMIHRWKDVFNLVPSDSVSNVHPDSRLTL